jgi:DNA-binding MarR family transcriptional regulator
MSAAIGGAPLESEDEAAGAAPVDLGPLPEMIGYALRRAQLAVFQDFIQAFAALDIRPAQYSVLVVIERNPGLSQSAIGAALGIKRSNLVPLIDALEARGLARRSAANDRRSHALHLTDQGAALLAELTRLQRAHEQRLTALIGPEQRAGLLELLQALTQMARP